jgi:hypothetical protein
MVSTPAAEAEVEAPEQNSRNGFAHAPARDRSPLPSGETSVSASRGD